MEQTHTIILQIEIYILKDGLKRSIVQIFL